MENTTGKDIVERERELFDLGMKTTGGLKTGSSGKAEEAKTLQNVVEPQ